MNQARLDSQCANIAQTGVSIWPRAHSNTGPLFYQDDDSYWITETKVVGKYLATTHSISGMTPGIEGGTMNQCYGCGETLDPHDGSHACPMCSITIQTVSGSTAHDQYRGTTVEVR